MGTDPTTLGDLLRVASPGFDRWQDQIHRTGGCADPIRLPGRTITRDKTTGELLLVHHRGRAGRHAPHRLRQPPRLPLPGLRLDLRRRHLPPDPRRPRRRRRQGHPRHRPRPPPRLRHPHRPLLRPGPQPARQPAAAAAAPATRTTIRRWARRSTPRRTTTPARCCGTTTPGELWRASPSTSAARSPPAPASPRRALKETARVSFGKVAEYQKRGAVHFHAVIRLDGPDGPDTPPPSWATVELLDRRDPRRRRPRRTRPVTVPAAGGPARPHPALGHPARRPAHRRLRRRRRHHRTGRRLLRRQVRHQGRRDHRHPRPPHRQLAEARPLLGVPDHTRRLIAACLDLRRRSTRTGRLRAWAHMLGFRGHFSTKSRRYSTTLGEPCARSAPTTAPQERDALGLPETSTTGEAPPLVLAHWPYAGHGHTPGRILARRQHRSQGHPTEHERSHAKPWPTCQITRTGG